MQVVLKVAFQYFHKDGKKRGERWLCTESYTKTRGLKKGDNVSSSACMFITLTDMMDLMRWSSACVSILGYCGTIDYY